MNFIKSLMSRDNFWNLIFWLGMILSASVVDLFKGFSLILAVLFLVLTFTVTPYLLAKVNKVTYTNDKIFINKQGQVLNDRYPKQLVVVLGLSMLVSAQLFSTFSKTFPLLGNSMLGYIGTVFLCPILYFILKNCPVSILFNKHAWCEEVTGIIKNDTNQAFNPSSSSLKIIRSLYPSSRSSNLRYKYLNSRIHRRN